jgi:hypothetical protein
MDEELKKMNIKELTKLRVELWQDIKKLDKAIDKKRDMQAVEEREVKFDKYYGVIALLREYEQNEALKKCTSSWQKSITQK